MKNEVRDDAELRAAFAVRDAADRPGAPGERARPAVHRRAHRALPARVRLARRLEPRVHVPHLPRAAGAGRRARPRLLRERLRLPDEIAAMRRDIEAARRDPRGPDGDALDEMRAAHAINLRMAPLTPGPPLLHRPGRQRPPPARADRGRRKLVEAGPARCARRRHVPALQRAAGLIGRPEGDRGPRHRGRAPGGTRAGERSSRATGSGRSRRRSSRSRISSTGASRTGSTAAVRRPAR